MRKENLQEMFALNSMHRELLFDYYYYIAVFVDDRALCPVEKKTKEPIRRKNRI